MQKLVTAPQGEKGGKKEQKEEVKEEEEEGEEKKKGYGSPTRCLVGTL